MTSGNPDLSVRYSELVIGVSIDSLTSRSHLPSHQSVVGITMADSLSDADKVSLSSSISPPAISLNRRRSVTNALRS